MLLGSCNLDGQASWNRSKTVYSKTVFKRGTSSEQCSKNISRDWHITIHSGLSSSKHGQMHLELLNFTTSNQIIKNIFYSPKYNTKSKDYSSLGWGCTIHRLHLCRGVRTPSTDVFVYDIKLSDGDDPTLEIWRMWSTPLLPLLPRHQWPDVIEPKGPIDGSNRTICLQTNDWC